jgi:hypothetical protein
MPAPKFSFVPEHQIEKSNAKKDYFFYCSIVSNGQLMFCREYIEVYELHEKFIELYIDKDKRTIGWRFIEGNSSFEEISKSRQLKKTPKGIIRVSVSKLLKHLGWQKGESYLRLPIEIYKSQTMVGEIFYVKLPDILARHD